MNDYAREAVAEASRCFAPEGLHYTHERKLTKIFQRAIDAATAELREANVKLESWLQLARDSNGVLEGALTNKARLIAALTTENQNIRHRLATINAGLPEDRRACMDCRGTGQAIWEGVVGNDGTMDCPHCYGTGYDKHTEVLNQLDAARRRIAQLEAERDNIQEAYYTAQYERSGVEHERDQAIIENTTIKVRVQDLENENCQLRKQLDSNVNELFTLEGLLREAQVFMRHGTLCKHVGPSKPGCTCGLVNIDNRIGAYLNQNPRIEELEKTRDRQHTELEQDEAEVQLNLNTARQQDLDQSNERIVELEQEIKDGLEQRDIVYREFGLLLYQTERERDEARAACAAMRQRFLLLQDRLRGISKTGSVVRFKRLDVTDDPYWLHQYLAERAMEEIRCDDTPGQVILDELDQLREENKNLRADLRKVSDILKRL